MNTWAHLLWGRLIYVTQPARRAGLVERINSSTQEEVFGRQNFLRPILFQASDYLYSNNNNICIYVHAKISSSHKRNRQVSKHSGN